MPYLLALSYEVVANVFSSLVVKSDVLLISVIISSISFISETASLTLLTPCIKLPVAIDHPPNFCQAALTLSTLVIPNNPLFRASICMFFILAVKSLDSVLVIWTSKFFILVIISSICLPYFLVDLVLLSNHFCQDSALERREISVAKPFAVTEVDLKDVCKFANCDLINLKSAALFTVCKSFFNLSTLTSTPSIVFEKFENWGLFFSKLLICSNSVFAWVESILIEDSETFIFTKAFNSFFALDSEVNTCSTWALVIEAPLSEPNNLVILETSFVSLSEAVTPELLISACNALNCDWALLIPSVNLSDLKVERTFSAFRNSDTNILYCEINSLTLICLSVKVSLEAFPIVVMAFLTSLYLLSNCVKWQLSVIGLSAFLSIAEAFSWFIWLFKLALAVFCIFEKLSTFTLDSSNALLYLVRPWTQPINGTSLPLSSTVVPICAHFIVLVIASPVSVLYLNTAPVNFSTCSYSPVSSLTLCLVSVV